MADASLPEPGAIGAGEGDSDDGDDSGVEERVATVVAARHGERLDKAIVAFVPEFSRSHLQQLIRGGEVTVDGSQATGPAQRVRAGQRIAVRLQPTAESRAYVAEELPLAIVHEDSDILVIDKAAGMVVHPAAGNWSGTLLNALLARDAMSAALPRAGIVHRLDKDTSGLMVVGRTLAAVTALVRAIAAREVQRRYLAIAHGAPPGARWSVDAPIGRDPRTRTKMAVVAHGRPARTDFERIAVRDRVAALRCTRTSWPSSTPPPDERSPFDPSRRATSLTPGGTSSAPETSRGSPGNRYNRPFPFDASGPAAQNARPGRPARPSRRDRTRGCNQPGQDLLPDPRRIRRCAKSRRDAADEFMTT